MIQAVIFDFDGLIIDTETPWFEAYRKAFNAYGVDLPLDIWARCIGTSFDVYNPYTYVEQRAAGQVDRDWTEKMAKEHYAALMKDKTPRPGVAQYLEEAKQLELRIGLASSSSRQWVHSYLKDLGLYEHFDVIHTSDDVERVKPDPALYLKALTSLDVRGSEAVAFEDSLNGLRAARAAGLYCVIVPNEATAGLAFEGHHLRLASMADRDLAAIIAELTNLRE